MSDSITAYYDRLKDEEDRMNASFKKEKFISTPKQDKYVQIVKEKFEQRSQTGIKKYNTTLERDDLSFLDWLNHLQEELMDATLYLEKLKDFAKKNT